MNEWVGFLTVQVVQSVSMPLHHILITLSRGCLIFLRYCLSEPPVTISVMSTSSSFTGFVQADMK